MKYKILIFSLFVILTESFGKTYTFSVELETPSDIDIIASVDITKFSIGWKKGPLLFQLVGSKRIPVPSQLDGKNLFWIIEGPVSKGILRYEITSDTNEAKFNKMRAAKDSGQLIIKFGEKNLLSYHFGIVYPPGEIDTIYKRSAFIHPLWTPHGQELTRIQPSDHYHHFGIWNPWTRVLFEGDTVDFWNLRDRKGTVRFKEFTKIVEGPIFSEYEAIHQHIVFKKDRCEKTALNEWQKVRVYKPHNDVYLVDITINYKCVGESRFKILEYRYAGLGWRATGEWNNQNSEIITSENKTRENADGSLAQWFIYQGKLGTDSGGLAILSYPENYNHPEPIRVWPPDMYNRGDVFANFAPTKNKDWLLEPGNTYTLKYRFIVFNGYMVPDKIRSAYKYYSTRLSVN